MLNKILELFALIFVITLILGSVVTYLTFYSVHLIKFIKNTLK